MNFRKTSLKRSKTYLRAVSFRAFMQSFFYRQVVVVLALIIAIAGRTQDCSQADANQLCADGAVPASELDSTPFNFDCLNVTSSYFYSFHTNSVADIYSADITITPVDCDNPIGADLIEIMVVQIASGADPCDPLFYQNPVCAGDNQEFSLQLTQLLPDQDYLIIVGSDHDFAYGPCTYTIDLAGDAVDLVASADPPFMTLGESSQLLVEGADPNVSVNWNNQQFLDNPGSTTPIATPEENMTFTVTGQVGGCIVTDQVTLDLAPPIIIYNTITPNGDGINDEWNLVGIQRFPNCQVNVFDRWGQNIFKSTGYAKPWNGTYKGNYLPTAAYFYTIELNSLEVTIAPITGTISIVH